MSQPIDVARWMLEELRSSNGLLYQEIVVGDIAQRFGEEFTYTNENGNQAIDKTVLMEFRKLTSSTVVWDAGERCWRLREAFDDPTKRQAE